MKTIRSNKLYSCVETSYTDVSGDDVDVFIGSHEDCLEWMRHRFDEVVKDSEGVDNSMSWVDKNCGLGHAVCQGVSGEFRYEWYVVIPKVKA